MSKNLSLLCLVILVFISRATYASAENTNLFGRPNSITFKGEDQNWLVVHQMYLVGTEIEYETKIRYKGDNEKIKTLPTMYYSFTDKGENLGVGGVFSLKESNEFKIRMVCDGCQYFDKKKKITFTVGDWEDYEERVVLFRE
ncbi:hypothetical protein FZC76_10320 [Sutcliffiella horikoshii]|uniref:Uncharacterized protein n=1 Tax=Sutcliffiella horikoshii TaxID=79883 RepID=A0A5D4SXN1_9BACI|nr:hypothetical protein [Sutcliffiella horikoshii]TYS68133.1 hypothetical protein FZC76_10320 [Sutcliffiella horikoshii]